MANCIIHVGMHTTGTAAIQASLESLDDASFLFPRLNGSANHSLPILTAFSDTPIRRALLARHGGDAQKAKAYIHETRRELKAAIASLNGRSLVLSGEGISGLRVKELLRLRVFLTEHDLQPVIYAYVRKPAALMTSAAQQRIRDGAAGGMALEQLYKSYRKRFAKFDVVFGQDQVKLRLFDEHDFPDRDIARDFHAWAGITGHPVNANTPEDVASRKAMSLFYQYHQHRGELNLPPLRGAAAQRLTSFLSAGDPNLFRLSPSLVSSLMETNADDVAWMEERLGQSIKEDLGAPRPGDVSSEEDLLAPVEGLREKLLETLAEGKAVLTAGPSSSIYQLMADYAKTGARDAAVPPTNTAKPIPKAKRAEAGPVSKLNETEADAMMEPVTAQRPRGIPAALAPTPMLNVHKNLMVIWSPKAACTTAYVWFSHISGFLPQVRKHHNWPHKHRTEKYHFSKLYFDSLKGDVANYRTVRIIRDPYGRAVSIYRHALQTRFADKAVHDYSKGRKSLEDGMSFLEFLELVAALDMKAVDIHFRPQFHPYEATRQPDRIINISKEDLFAGLNAFERDGGMPETDFQQFNWLHDMEGKRKAHQAAMEGEALDRAVFSRQQVVKRKQFPSYGQLLTPEAKQMIDAIYKADFEAYRDYL